MTRAVPAIVLGCACAFAAALACSSGNPPTAGGETSVKPGQTVTSGEDAGRKPSPEAGADAASGDASGSAPRAEAGMATPVTCDSIAAKGDVVEELAVAGEMPPPLGGTIRPGTYVLFELYDYPGAGDAGGTTGFAAQKSLVLGATTYRLADAEGNDDAGLGSSTVTGGTYTVDGTTMTRSQECPSVSTSTNGYSASGSQLGLYRDTHFEVYELQTPP